MEQQQQGNTLERPTDEERVLIDLALTALHASAVRIDRGASIPTDRQIVQRCREMIEAADLRDRERETEGRAA